MRPAQIAREIERAIGGSYAGSAPSMRPAQIAREIATTMRERLSTILAFNEARANCAGNYDVEGTDDATLGPSMRPAQIAREILLS